MRFNRDALIAACDRAMKADRDRHDRRVAKAEAQDKRDIALWLSMYGEAWAKAALAIRRAIRNGQPVTSEMLPRDINYGRSVTFRSTAQGVREYREPVDLIALRAVLDTVADDVVSISALERLGIRKDTIRSVAQHLAAATIAEVNS